jgi:phage tail P2-like protein
MNNGITKENLLFVLPPALREDEATGALAEATAELLAKRLEEIGQIKVISGIDGLNEELLAILARDFKVDWWDPNYTLEEKRQTVKDSWKVHKKLGTKAAVETAISAIYPDTQVVEWFEYGGEPYHFRLLIDATFENIDPEKHQRVMERVECYKNLRSHLDEVEYYDRGGQAVQYFGAAVIGYEVVDAATAKQY